MNLKKLIFPVLGAAVLLSSCGEKTKLESFTLNGQIASDKYNGTNVYLQTTDLLTDSTVNLDTATVKNGKFTFTYELTNQSPSVGLLSYEGSSRAIPFIMEKDTITLSIDSTKSVNIKGTPLNDLYQQYMNNVNNSNSTEQYQKAIYDYIKANINNPVGEFFLMTRGKALNADQLKDLLAIADSKVKSFANYSSLENRLKVLEATAIGKPFTDLKGLTPEGKEISLSEFAGKGKYTLIDFWASWCPPCRREMPAVVALYDQYKDKDFNIVGVSLDDVNADWQKGISDLHVTWPQMSDLKGWKSPLAEAYGVTSIPQTFLLDKEGIIIDKGFNAEELAVKLKELIK